MSSSLVDQAAPPTQRAYRFQLRLQPAAERQLRRFSGMARWVWNQAIAQQQRQRAAGEKFSGYAAMCQWLTAWRNAPETAWLAEGPVHAQQQVLRRLEAAYKRFFEGQGGYPRFKGRGDDPGLRFPDPKQFELDPANGRVRLPKLGWLRMRQSRPVLGKIKNASLAQVRGKWFVSLQAEHAGVLPAAGLEVTLGIDLGVAVFAATSDGELVAPLAAMKTQAKRVRHAQRAVSRKVKGSKNRRNAIDRLGRLHQRIAAQRLDWLHKLSTRLVREHPVIAMEDLQVKVMAASAKGTADAPGRRVRQKAGLNRAIADQAWSLFSALVDYKARAVGGARVPVPPAYTSQTCRKCGHVSAANRPTQSLFLCLACGHTENADTNAAHIIEAVGHTVWTGARAQAHAPSAACGGEVRRARRTRARSAAPAKQEPTEGAVPS